ncbi:hypothetical protein A3842_11560 [Paenibacillus sp. P3E]|nr:hypothetical protein A3842_11560 [Paenibacillus sp. P3E]
MYVYLCGRDANLFLIEMCELYGSMKGEKDIQKFSKIKYISPYYEVNKASLLKSKEDMATVPSYENFRDISFFSVMMNPYHLVQLEILLRM